MTNSSLKSFIGVAMVMMMLALSSCSQQKNTTMPANKKEVMDRFVAGTLPASYTPAAFFAHFGSNQKEGEAAVQAHL